MLWGDMSRKSHRRDRCSVQPTARHHHAWVPRNRWPSSWDWDENNRQNQMKDPPSSSSCMCLIFDSNSDMPWWCVQVLTLILWIISRQSKGSRNWACSPWTRGVQLHPGHAKTITVSIWLRQLGGSPAHFIDIIWHGGANTQGDPKLNHLTKTSKTLKMLIWVYIPDLS